ncbi:hypothetical protein BKA67DRAFT_655075 [Truncatella angustata]|uniref:Uncharacterized protein n=1 Tax=Truncatella angustata TaxID=152316 RepID=A0A9P9A184_9PEZI|nr:uncharacterized protein BKA67DRAFT_655075 [Truncatella angustata]KAH6656765.1 hypothetical protein BKA67DRAFT_655075 [Truncatella angustata]KAH8196312.1 hypothetical protein TruAng_009524 [Truncatella angustata]
MTDKRRGASSSTSHPIRSTASSRSSSIIAPPPRAQLGNASASSVLENDDASSIKSREGSIKEQREGSIKDKDYSSSSGTAALLKEKDEKISELKRGLIEIEAEFARQVERLSQNESETAAFWQSKHSTLNQQFLRTDTELRLLRAEMELREGERDEFNEGLEFFKREIKARDDEIRRLRTDLMGLKKWLSTSTRTEEQESDELFAGDMARLGNGLQEWAIQHFRRTKIVISKASPSVENELSQLVPMYSELAKTSKLPLLQSIVSTILVEMIFDAYFVGLSKDQANKLKQTQECLESLSGEESANQWRAVTLTMVRKEASLKLHAETTAIVEDVIARVTRILSSIVDVDTTDARDHALRGLVNTAIELARRLAVQKAVFKVTMPQILPHQKTIFDPSEMEDIGGEDEDGLSTREICCVTFPSVIKTGDEHGSHSHLRNIVSKARVLCSPE